MGLDGTPLSPSRSKSAGLDRDMGAAVEEGAAAAARTSSSTSTFSTSAPRFEGVERVVEIAPDPQCGQPSVGRNGRNRDDHDDHDDQSGARTSSTIGIGDHQRGHERRTSWQHDAARDGVVFMLYAKRR